MEPIISKNVPGLVVVFVALAVGYGVTAIYAVRQIRVARRIRSVEEKGREVFLLCVVAIPSSLLAGLIWGSLVLIAADVFFNVKFSPEWRIGFGAAIALAFYVSAALLSVRKANSR